METIVIFNKGRDAFKAGLARVAPDEVEYPIVSKYMPYHTVTAFLSDFMKREFLRGYDHQARSA